MKKRQLLFLAIVGLMLSLAAGQLMAQAASSSTPSTDTSTTTKKTTAKPATAAPASAPPSVNSYNTSAKPPATKTAATTAATAGPPPQKGMVWVNTDSGVYHKEGTRYYGKTKQGKYMTEANAQKAGYKPAKSGD